MQGQTPRFGFRTTVDFGALPNTATKSVVHNIPIDVTAGPQYTATRIIGAATDPAGLTYIPIPFSSPVLADNIAVTVDNTNINVTTGSNRTNFTRCIIWFDYLKQ